MSEGEAMTRDRLARHIGEAALGELMAEAASIRDAGHGEIVSYSRKVFIPLTRLCRDVRRYCTFARPPPPGEAPYLEPDAVPARPRAGRCHGWEGAVLAEV